MIIELKKPAEFEGETTTALNLDLDSLTGADLRRIERKVRKQLAAEQMTLTVAQTDTDYLLAVAAQAAGQPVEFFDALAAPDFTAVTMAVQNFLLGG